MTENTQIPAAQNANEDPGKPTEGARNPQTGEIQKAWNSGHPGGVAAIEDPPEYTPSNLDSASSLPFSKLSFDVQSLLRILREMLNLPAMSEIPAAVKIMGNFISPPHGTQPMTAAEAFSQIDSLFNEQNTNV